MRIDSLSIIVNDLQCPNALAQILCCQPTSRRANPPACAPSPPVCMRFPRSRDRTGPVLRPGVPAHPVRGLEARSWPGQPMRSRPAGASGFHTLPRAVHCPQSRRSRMRVRVLDVTALADGILMGCWILPCVIREKAREARNLYRQTWLQAYRSCPTGSPANGFASLTCTRSALYNGRAAIRLARWHGCHHQPQMSLPAVGPAQSAV